MNGLILGITKAILSSLDTIFRKKSLEINKVSANVFMFMGTMGTFFIALILLGFGLIDVANIFTRGFVCLIGINFFGTIANKIEQKIYKEEKLSVLAPYSNLDIIIVVITSFFIFSGKQSLVSFSTAIMAAILIAGSSIDFKNFSVPKGFSSLICAKFIRAGKSLFVGYMLLTLNSIDYFFLNSASYLLLQFIMIFLISKDFATIKNSNTPFLKVRIFSVILGNIGAIMGLFLIKSLGLVISNLLGFLSLAVTLVFSYFFFKDIPTKKNIFVTFLVCALVGVGIYFK
ncbi:MAG: hypothetical protein PHF46_02285 [Candidatus Gracilibacteria bacterium]|nr:hypothetical protein [Candidatus Gracilibacteria bacterium]MDD3120210.1 hypothetical protein [Candidatus Gracilibacteria bacterium]MDD4529968.1 hypothetical protein [Candidatus Gracilibacteria bacterium]